MAKHRGGKFYEFLCLLGRVPIRIDEIAVDLGQRKCDVHRHLHKAEVLGVIFIREHVNGGLYSIEVAPGSFEKLELCLKLLVDKK